jgi:para-nitrobenzyl esterase
VKAGCPATHRVQVTPPEGVFEGRVENSVRAFFSLAYPAPIIDENRFRAPWPVEAWPGVRDATRLAFLL